MAIKRITRSAFDKKNPARNPMVEMFSTEVSWFTDTSGNIIGTVIFDKGDKDYNYVVLGPSHFGDRRYINGDGSIADLEAAEVALTVAMEEVEKAGKVTEKLFHEDTEDKGGTKSPVVLTDINEELKAYFAKHPEKMRDLTSRKFEELIASILKDLGFDVELTQATRDGGRDIIAYVRNAVCSFLTYVECKKYGPTNKVGVGIIREVAGVHHIRKANKSLIVTTSFFTKAAVEEARMIQHELELKDYEEMKVWLRRYAK
jgi:HJR/Mrr/RecB family endonuclease